MAEVPPERTYLIAVASQHALVSESVRAALVDRSFDAVAVRWPGGVPLPRNPRVSTRYDAGLLLGDLERAAHLRAATLLVTHTPTPWLVLSDTPRGPLWGAMYDAGARMVLPSNVSLDELAALLPGLARGRIEADAGERAELIQAWRRLQAERELLTTRLDSLTPRERDVLGLLNAGETVAVIAAILEVSLSTVRSQVKSILRKLGVNSQLAAVAAYRIMLDLESSAGRGTKGPLSHGI